MFFRVEDQNTFPKHSPVWLPSCASGMEGTPVSATEYIDSGRALLLEGLRNLELLVEELQERRVFTEDVASSITASPQRLEKVKKLLDTIIETGEGASYAFLEVLCLTADRTCLPQQHSTSEQALDEWVNLFFSRYKPQLKSGSRSRCCLMYQNALRLKAKEILNNEWIQIKRILKDDTNLRNVHMPFVSKITKKSSVRQKSSSTENEDLSPDDLLKVYEKKVLILGESGIGKTALVLKALRQWLEKEYSETDYMFYFDMDTLCLSEQLNLKSLLFSKYCNCHFGIDADEVFQDIKEHSNKVVIIFDGVSESMFSSKTSGTGISGTVNVDIKSLMGNILRKSILPEAKVIVTCQPHFEKKFLGYVPDWQENYRVEILGFSKSSISKFFEAVLNETLDLSYVLNNPEMLNLCRIPRYTFMFAACILSQGNKFSGLPTTITELYLHIFHLCLGNQSVRKEGIDQKLDLGQNTEESREEVQRLAEQCFNRLMLKPCGSSGLTSVNNMQQADSDESHSSLLSLMPSHHCMEAFWASFWLLGNPEKVNEVLHQWRTDRGKQMEFMISSLCALISSKNTKLVKCIVPESKMKVLTDECRAEVIDMLLCSVAGDVCEMGFRNLFACFCLYGYQSPEACIHFLKEQKYKLDLSSTTLDTFLCCAVSYIIKQSREKKVRVNLENCSLSEPGLNVILSCLQHVQSFRGTSLTRALWKTALQHGQQREATSLLTLSEKEVHFPVQDHCESLMLATAAFVMKHSEEKIQLNLNFAQDRQQPFDALVEMILNNLSNIHTICFSVESFTADCFGMLGPSNLSEQSTETIISFLLDLYLQAAITDVRTGKNSVQLMLLLCNFEKIPFKLSLWGNSIFGHNIQEEKHCDFLLKLFSKAKEYETVTGRRVLRALRVVYDSVSADWVVDLTKTKASLFLEVLKLQSAKTPVTLLGCSHEESEMRNFLQCLPYISTLSFPWKDAGNDWQQNCIKFLVSLFIQATQYKTTEGDNALNLLTSVCNYSTFPFGEHCANADRKCDFLLDLYSQLKGHGLQVFTDVLPALQPIFETVSEVWNVDLSKREAALLLEVLKLTLCRKPVKLKGWTYDETEQSLFLQCLPYISQISFSEVGFKTEEERRGAVKFMLDLYLQAQQTVESDDGTGGDPVALLSSACSFSSFPFTHLVCPMNQCEFLVDLYFCAKELEAQTGRDVSSALQPIFHTAPAFWEIDLSRRSSSLFLEILKLHKQKPSVQLLDWSESQDEQRNIVRCLPYISHLKIFDINTRIVDPGTFAKIVRTLINLHLLAADQETQTGERLVSMVPQLCWLQILNIRAMERGKDECEMLLHLYLHMLEYEAQTGRQILPALLPVFQSTRETLVVDLFPSVKSCRKLPQTSRVFLFLSVLKLQTEKKPVELWGWPNQEEEVLCFLQCLPYISQLSFSLYDAVEMQQDCRLHQPGSHLAEHFSEERKQRLMSFLQDMCVCAVKHKDCAGENLLLLLQSVCCYSSFPLTHSFYKHAQSNFLLDLYLKMKNCEAFADGSVLLALQQVYQSAPDMWVLDFSKGKCTHFPEVLKFQVVRKPVEVRGWSDDETYLRILLQCLPHISHLSFGQRYYDEQNNKEWGENLQCFLLNLFIQAEKFDILAGEKAVRQLSYVCSSSSFPFLDTSLVRATKLDFLTDLYSHAKVYESQTGTSVIPSMYPVFQTTPSVWKLDFSKGKVSLCLELLKLQTEKKTLEIEGCSNLEMKNFLQYLPYMSQLRFSPWPCYDDVCDEKEEALMFLINLCAQVEHGDAWRIPQVLDLSGHSDFLLDLYSHAKGYEAETGKRVLSVLKPVYELFPAVWIVDLSKTMVSLLLEVLRLQSGKRKLELLGWPAEDSEMKCLLMCLPYISQLRITPGLRISASPEENSAKSLIRLCAEAALCDMKTGGNVLQSFSSVCSFSVFPFDQRHAQLQCDFLLKLYSLSKNYEVQTGQVILPALQPIYQSAPEIWAVNLSKVKACFFLEVLRFQSVAKPIELEDWSEEESEIRSFIQCLPYISQLRFPRLSSDSGQHKRAIMFIMNVCVQSQEHDIQTGGKALNYLSSALSFVSFPFWYMHDDNSQTDQCNFLLDLYVHAKDMEAQTGRRCLPALQSLFQCAPSTWIIDLSKRKASVFLEVLKLQSVRKPVILTGWEDDDCELQHLLLCLPYISKLKVLYFHEDQRNFEKDKEVAFFLLKLCFKAAENERGIEAVLPVLGFREFHCHDCKNAHSRFLHTSYLLDLHALIKDYAGERLDSVLPALKFLFQTSAEVWILDLSKHRMSIFLEVLKFLTGKKPVEVKGLPYDDNECRLFLQCLPYISKLSCDGIFFQAMCKVLPMNTQEEETIASLLLEAMDFSITLGGRLSEEDWSSVGRVLGVSSSTVKLTLILEDVSVQGVHFLLKHTTHLRHLRMNENITVTMARNEILMGIHMEIDELSVTMSTTPPQNEMWSEFLSNLLKLLTYWRVQSLDLKCCCIDGHSLSPLLGHPAPLEIRLGKKSLQQLAFVVYQAQEEKLTLSFLEKIGGDLTAMADWEVIFYLLKHATKQVSLDLCNIWFKEENIKDLLPLLEKVRFKRLEATLLLAFIREVFESTSHDSVTRLLTATDNCINLDGCVLQSSDCAALQFFLHHTDKISLSLQWVSIAEENLPSILTLLPTVTRLRVDSRLLLQLLHASLSTEEQQNIVAPQLLRALQYELDLSHSSERGPSRKEQQILPLHLSTDDCRAISNIIQLANCSARLCIQHCEIQDAGLMELFPVLPNVQLCPSKDILHRFFTLMAAGDDGDSKRQAEALSRAIGKRVDLSHKQLGLKACRQLAWVLKASEGLSELNLSHCSLTDDCIHLLHAHLHKVQTLDLSDNRITDRGALKIHHVVSNSTVVQTVRLCNNKIHKKTLFMWDERYEIKVWNFFHSWCPPSKCGLEYPEELDEVFPNAHNEKQE
ncbi:uncharacterized protein LOC108941173 isoform X1 [Scleropages formosus]|nr:uncharacterized protein LOC108941173 isoform X1 [Scleropages formosus]